MSSSSSSQQSADLAEPTSKATSLLDLPDELLWTAFADDVARALLEAQQCDTIGELFRREHKAALDRGEMRLSFRDDLRSCAAEVERRAGAGGAGGDEPERRSAFRCEDEWTARGIFREA